MPWMRLWSWRTCITYGCWRMRRKRLGRLFWLRSVNPLLNRQDLKDIADAAAKVATAFIAKREAGIAIRYASNDPRARLEWLPRTTLY